MNITILGTGYVGLVSGVCLAEKNNNVICVDIKQSVVDSLNKGILHIYENNLEELLHKNLSNGRFKITNDLNIALDNSDIVIIAVGTPSDNGKIDLTQIKNACIQVGKYIKNTTRFLSVVIKSTVVPTTTDTFARQILENESGKKIGEFGLGMNPEFLKEGEAIADFMQPDRIVIGYEDEKTKEYLTNIYSDWNCDKIYTNTRTAEMIKYTNNTLLACLISINNELANVAATLKNIDYNGVIKGVLTDKRWSPIIDNVRILPKIGSYFTPGAGFGGSCFPKDVYAIKTQGNELGLNMHMTKAILDVNEAQSDQVLKLLRQKYHDINDKKVLMLGLAFKENTDDIRESSAIRILNSLLKNNIDVSVHDPIAIPNTRKLYPTLNYINNWQSKINEYDIIIIGTNWEEYKLLKNYLTIFKENNTLIFDTKRLFNTTEMNDVDYLTFGYIKL